MGSVGRMVVANVYTPSARGLRAQAPSFLLLGPRRPGATALKVRGVYSARPSRKLMVVPAEGKAVPNGCRPTGYFWDDDR